MVTPQREVKVIGKFTGNHLKRLGFVRAEEYDFTDDRAYFKGYVYRDEIVATYTAYEGTIFLSLRFDYAYKLSIPYEVHRAFGGLDDKYNYHTAFKINEEVMHRELTAAYIDYMKYIGKPPVFNLELDKLYNIGG